MYKNNAILINENSCKEFITVDEPFDCLNTVYLPRHLERDCFNET